MGFCTGKSKTIGMIVEDISNPFFSAIARVVEASAYNNGYRVIYGSSENDPNKTTELLQTFRDHHVDGYIIVPPPGMERAIRRLMTDGFPVVIFDRVIPDIPCSKILVDNFNGAYCAITHLAENGYKNIMMITLASKQDQMEERARGFSTVISQYKLKGTIKALPYHEDRIQTIESIKASLKSHQDVDAVFFATNYFAISGLAAFKQLNISVPVNMGVVVFDDSYYFELFNPSITAVAQPVEAIGEQVTKMLIAELQNEHAIMPQTILLKTKLMIRESSVINTLAKDPS